MQNRVQNPGAYAEVMSYSDTEFRLELRNVELCTFVYHRAAYFQGTDLGPGHSYRGRSG